MLSRLSIRDVVLIDRLDIDFSNGLNVFTGETGAGKSVLLDSLSLALGARAEASLVRRGAKQASVTAEFVLPDSDAVFSVLEEHGLTREAGEPLILRRVVSADGKSRAFVNDDAVGVGVLRQIGDALVEIHGQFASFGLLNPATHRGVLDAFAHSDALLSATTAAFEKWMALTAEKQALITALEKARSDEDFIRHSVEELEAFSPKEGEEQELADRRALMMNSEKLVEGLQTARNALAADNGIRTAQRALERVASFAPDRFDPIIASLDAAAVALNDASFAVEEQCAAVDLDPREQERVEERLFSMRSLARKYQTTCDGLPTVLTDFQGKLAALDKGTFSAGEIDKKVAAARLDYMTAAQKLSAARHESARLLDAAVRAELPPLKLEKATFVTRVDALPETAWRADGMDDVRFTAATNAGQTAGALDKIASGGELSRFMLALKVVLATVGHMPTMVFDEVDSGVGGSTATAVGERLKRLATDKKTQVLVVTHSPQVAAFGERHFRVSKATQNEVTQTSVALLSPDERREEIARMLAGATVTNASRAAADELLSDERKA